MCYRERGFGHFTALKFVGVGFADESGGHVRLWLTRLRLGLCMVSYPTLLPICILSRFRSSSLNELVHDGVNGLVFHNAQELATQLAVGLLYPQFVPY